MQAELTYLHATNLLPTIAFALGLLLLSPLLEPGMSYRPERQILRSQLFNGWATTKTVEAP
jgi:hypothetical protein